MQKLILSDKFSTWRWKDCICAIYETYLQADPTNKQHAYRNRKVNILLNVLGACDFDMQFTFIATWWEGTTYDNKVPESMIADPTAKFFSLLHGIKL